MSNPFEDMDSEKLTKAIEDKATQAKELEKKIDEQISKLKSQGPFVF